MNINKLIALLYLSYLEEFPYNPSYKTRHEMLLSFAKYVDWQKTRNLSGFGDPLNQVTHRLLRIRYQPFSRAQQVRSTYRARWFGICSYSNYSRWTDYQGVKNQLVKVQVLYDRKGNPVKEPFLKEMPVKYLEPVNFSDYNLQ